MNSNPYPIVPKPRLTKHTTGVFAGLVLGLLAIPVPAAAQIQDYFFEESTSTFRTLTGGTVLVSSGDYCSREVTLPFEARLMDTRAQTLEVSCDGVISFSTSDYFGYTNRDPTIEGTGTGRTNYIAPFWDDLVVGNGAGLPAAIQVKVDGSAPDRRFTIEWTNVKRYGRNDSILNFQVRFYESGDTQFEINYGPTTPGVQGADFNSTMAVKTTHPHYLQIDPTCTNDCNQGNFMPRINRSYAFKPRVYTTMEVAVTQVSVPGGYTAGQLITVSADILNRSSASGDVDYNIYLRSTTPTDATKTSTVNLVAGPFSFTTAVTSNSVTKVVQQVTVPAATTGRLYVTVVADPDDAHTEQIETDNFGYAVTSAGTTPNVKLTRVLAPSGFDPGAPGIVRVSYQNLNLPMTGGVTVHFWASTNTRLGRTTPEADDIDLGSQTVTLSSTEGEVELNLPLNIAATTLTPGSYHLFAVMETVAPTTGQISTPVKMSESPFIFGTDFAATGFTGLPATGAVNDQVDITYTVDATGSVYAGEVLVRFYWSNDLVVDANDLVAGTATIQAGSFSNRDNLSYSNNVTLNLPNAPMSPHLLMVVDPDNTIAEIVETNNLYASADPIIIGNDFKVDSLEITPAMGPVGSRAHLRVTASLDGPGFLGNVPLYVYFSTGSTFDADAAILVYRGSVFFQDTQDEEVSLEFDVNVEALKGPGINQGLNFSTGEYHVFAVINPPRTAPAAAIPEAVTTNNTSDGRATFVAQTPNLHIVSAIGAPFASLDRDYKLAIKLENTDDADAENVYISVHYSDNDTIRLQDPAIQMIGPYNVRAKSSIDIETTVLIPDDVPLDSKTGTQDYWIGLIIDPADRIAESSEEDNIALVQHAAGTPPAVVHFIKPAADLTGRFNQLPTRVSAGEAFFVNRSIVNVGTSTAGASSVTYAYFLSQDETLDATDLRISEGVATLDSVGEPGQVGLDRLLLPSDLVAGSYYLLLFVDSDERIGEVTEDNNITSSQPLEVYEAAIQFLSSKLPDGVTGMPYSGSVSVKRSPGTVTFSAKADTLPPGLSLAAETGIISGVPTQGGTFSFEVAATAPGVGEILQRFSILITSPTVELEVLTTTLLPGVKSRDYDLQLQAIGGFPPYRWKALSALPEGLALTAEGRLHGVLAASEDSSFEVEVEDTKNSTAKQKLAFNVKNLTEVLTVGLASSRDYFLVGRQSCVQFRAEHNVGEVTWSLANPNIPEGAAINPTTGQLCVKSPVVTEAGLIVRAVDTANQTDEYLFMMRVRSDSFLKVSTESLPEARVGQSYETQLAASRGTEPYTWTLNPSSDMPKGLELSESGMLSGTPETAGSYGLTIRVTDKSGRYLERAFALRVNSDKAESSDTSGGCTCTEPDAETPWGALGVLLGLGLWFFGKRRGLGLVVLLLLALPAEQAFAQVIPGTRYMMRKVENTFVPLDHPTDAANCQILSGDYGRINVTLPFSFRFYDNDYTHMQVSHDGVITFGDATTAPVSLTYTNGLLTKAGQGPLLALFWDDLYANTANPTCVSVRHVRDLNAVVVDYRNMSRYRTNGVFSMRAILFGGNSGRIIVDYGPFTTAPTAALSATMGMSDATNTRPIPFVTPDCGTTCSITDYRPDTRIILSQESRDLSIESATAPASAKSGNLVEIPTKFFTMTPDAVPADLPVKMEIYDAQVGGHLLSEMTVSVDLNGYGEHSLSMPFLMPYTAEEKMVYPRIHLDPEGRYEEEGGASAAENNRLNLNPIRLLPSVADLAVRTINITGGVNASRQVAGPLSIAVEGINGGSPAISGKMALMLSTNPIISAEDQQLAITDSRSFAPGVSQKHTFENITLPEALTTGTYYLGLLMVPDAGVQDGSPYNDALAAQPIVVETTNLAILTSALPNALLNQPYHAILGVAGKGKLFWNVSEGKLPKGLSLSPEGEITGTPTELGVSNFTVATSTLTNPATQELGIHVIAADAPLTIVSVSLPDGVQNGEYNTRLYAVGARLATGTATATWAISDGPKGLSVEDGFLRGVPRESGKFNLKVVLSDGTDTVEKVMPLEIQPSPTIRLLPKPLATATVLENYLAALEHEGGVGPYEWSVEGDQLKSLGLRLNLNGAVEGVPNHVGSYAFTVTVRDSATPRSSDTATLYLEVRDSGHMEIATKSLPFVVSGKEYDESVRATGGVPPYTWEVVSDLSTIPDGITFKTDEISNELRLRGTVKAEHNGSYPMVVRAKDSVGQMAEHTFALQVGNAPAVLDSASDDCSCTEVPEEGFSGLIALGLLGLALLVRQRRD